MDINTLADLLQGAGSRKDWLDVFSSLSVPILSLTALIITTLISVNQWKLMKHEYRIKLYPDRLDLYDHLIDILNELQQEDRIIGDHFRNQILKIENKIFIYGTDIDKKYQEFIKLINSFDAKKDGNDRSEYANQFKTGLLTIINAMKQYLLKNHIDIA